MELELGRALEGVCPQCRGPRLELVELGRALEGVLDQLVLGGLGRPLLRVSGAPLPSSILNKVRESQLVENPNPNKEDGELQR